MIARGAGGWQTVIADLALILFMVALSAVGKPEPKSGDAREANPLPAMGEPAAIYRAGADAPPIGEWLAAQVPDPRQRLTIIARYPAGGAGEAAEGALALSQGAGSWPTPARILLEPAGTAELLAVLAYDDGGSSWHANCRDQPREGGADAATQGDDPCEQSG
ncbi:conserved hypothetical protein [Altererythrobacter sp. B11]|uniref:hypothetical protein n=1 Tax=Altererythrobacter sp. B11 TaxID=2060312 RepID=UPI000DC7352A|nr:hypothetical protein [Altererythrobacter sp. B11]BBC72175.1 conserved hypothetical protein [Altererythrobacter sp. B11]